MNAHQVSTFAERREQRREALKGEAEVLLSEAAGDGDLLSARDVADDLGIEPAFARTLLADLRADGRIPA